VPMVCERKEQKARLVVELFVMFRAQAEFNHKGHEGTQRTLTTEGTEEHGEGYLRRGPSRELVDANLCGLG
jgi:hypothetical protein